MRRRAARQLAGGLVLALMLPILVYIGDAAISLSSRPRPGQREAHRVLRDASQERQARGRLEVFTDRPQTETCARALFPHFGYRPCWYVRRGGRVNVM